MKSHVLIPVDSSRIFLSDFFDREQLGEEEYDRLSTYVLGFAPLVGKTMEFDSEYIIGKLNFLFPEFSYIEPDAAVISVTKSTDYQPATEETSGGETVNTVFDIDAIRNITADYFLSEYMKFEGDVLKASMEQAEFEFEEPDKSYVSGDSYRITVSKYGNGEYMSNFSVYSEEKFLTNIRMKFKVRWLRNLTVAGRNINYGEAISREMVFFTEDDFIAKKDSVPEEEFRLGYVAKSFIRQGQNIQWASLKPAPYVLRGQIIQAVVDLKSVTVNVKVKLLSDGAIGDIVKAMNVESGAVISGILEEGPVLRVNY